MPGLIAPPEVMEAEIMKVTAGDLLRDLDLSGEELVHLLELAAAVKANPPAYAHALEGKSIALLFEKPSLRTRLTFELAIRQLGGTSVGNEGPVGGREPLKDVARNLDRWVNGIVARTFAQHTVDELARWSRVPVVNALTDLYHPCQALADVLTIRERFGGFAGVKVAFVGDGNNVAHSLMLTSVRLGADFTIATPAGYEPNSKVMELAEGLASMSGARVELTSDPVAAVRGAHAVYTDVWASMGQEQEAAERCKAFAPYQVNEALFGMAASDAVFMHCLPAKRQEEVTDGVIESERSVVFDQAENRLHAQKALLLMLL